MQKVLVKVIALITVMVLMLGMVTACGSKSETPAKETVQESQQGSAANDTQNGKKIEGEVKIVFPGDEPKDMANVKKALEEKMKAAGLNLTLNFTYFPWDQYNNKINLIPASGEEQDLVWTHVSWLSPLVAKKGLLPLDDLISEYGKNLKDNVPQAAFKDASINNKIYGIPTSVPTAENNYFMEIRGDLREKYGLPTVKTVEDLENYMKTVKKNNPNMVFQPDARALIRGFGDVIIICGDNGQGIGYVDPTDKNLQVKSYYESDIFKNIVVNMRKWYNEGLLPKDANEVKDGIAALNSGKLGLIWATVLTASERIDAFKAGQPDGKLEDVFLNPDKPKYIYEAASNMLSLFTTSKNPEGAMSFVNWFRSNQENYDLMSYGVKDVNYKLDGNSVSVDGIPAEKSYTQIFWAWDDMKYKRFSKNVSNEYIENLKVWDKDAVTSPTLGFRFDVDPVKSEVAQIKAIESEYAGAFEAGFSDYDKLFPEFQKKLKAAGLDKVIAEMQKQMDAFKANKK